MERVWGRCGRCCGRCCAGAAHGHGLGAFAVRREYEKIVRECGGSVGPVVKKVAGIYDEHGPWRSCCKERAWEIQGFSKGVRVTAHPALLLQSLRPSFFGSPLPPSPPKPLLPPLPPEFPSPLPPTPLGPPLATAISPPSSAPTWAQQPLSPLSFSA